MTGEKFDGQHEIKLFRFRVADVEKGVTLPKGWKPRFIDYVDGNSVRVTATYWHPSK
jgi:hypothetical protein